jgi:hypothetical protein
LILSEEVHKRDAGETSSSGSALNLERRGKQSRSNSRSAHDEESRSDAKNVKCYYCHKKCHCKRFCSLMKQDLEDKKNQKGSADSVNAAHDQSNDSEVNAYVLSVSSGIDSLIDS